MIATLLRHLIAGSRNQGYHWGPYTVTERPTAPVAANPYPSMRQPSYTAPRNDFHSMQPPPFVGSSAMTSAQVFAEYEMDRKAQRALRGLGAWAANQRLVLGMSGKL